jgi:hypothetical protein
VYAALAPGAVSIEVAKSVASKTERLLEETNLRIFHLN